MAEIHFAQIREDSLVELALVAEHRPRRVVAIASGGCTALSLLDDDVERVFAIDANPAQCALVELRRAALRRLDRDDYLRFVGERPAADRLATFRDLCPDLSNAARRFWAERPETIAAGLQQCGTTERFYRFVGDNLRRSGWGDTLWRELLATRDLEMQRALRDRYFRGEAWQTALRVLLSRTSHLAFFPEFMFRAVSEHDFGRFFAQKFDAELGLRPMAGNYFLSQLLFGAYEDEQPAGTPPYLGRERYEIARRNAHKLAVVAAPLEKSLFDQQRIDAFFLSNVFDWADVEGRERIARGVLAAAAPGAVVLHRNMLADAPTPVALTRRARVDSSAGERLFALERSMLYRSLWAGVLS